MVREAFVALILVLGAVLVAHPTSAAGVAILPYTNADGVTGYYALPADPSTATILVVVAHGYGHTASDWQQHLAEMASHGAIAVAVDYGNWQIRAGSAALISAAQDLRAQYPHLTTTVIYGISMGGAASGYALATAPHGTFDYWVDAEGATSMDETYVEANAVSSQAAIASQTVAEIEAECGHTHPADPVCLVHESALPHAADMQAEGLRGAMLIHDVNDGLVPYDQSAEMAGALKALQIPTSVTTVLRGNDGDLGTTATSYAGQQDVLDLAGHSDESSNTQMVIRTSLNLLDAYLDGGAPPGTAAPLIADAYLGTLP
ncbi:MAG: alpha/beta hydrolase family protein [Thermoplasmatota archaeon]